MDEETRAYLQAMEGRLMLSINNNHEQVVERLNAIEHDFQNTKGFLIEDALVLGRRQSSAERRVERLERPDEGTK